MRLIIIALLMSMGACKSLTSVMCVDALEGNPDAYMWIIGTERYILVKYPDAKTGQIYRIELTNKEKDEQ